MIRPFDANLWTELERDAAPNGLVRRRVLPSLTHDIFIGEERPSRLRQLTMSIRDSLSASAARGPRARGLDVHVNTSEAGVVHLNLASTSREANLLFAELASDVASVLESNPEHGVASRVLQRVLAWQAFYARRDDVFGKERAAGLFAELEILREVLVPAIGSSAAVVAWHGPDPALQDFQFRDLAVEVKSFRGNGSGHLAISSERQLETAGVGELYIAYLRLDQRTEGVGVTLAEQVKRTSAAVADSFFASDLLHQQLIAAGWHESFAEVRSEKYGIRSCEIFAVTGEFPSLVSGDLPVGIRDLSYAVDRSAIEHFLVPRNEFTQRLGRPA